MYEDFEQAKKEGVYDSDLKSVAKMLLQSKDALSRGTFNLSVQIVGRLGNRGSQMDATKNENQNVKDRKGNSKKYEEKKGKKDAKKDDKKKKGPKKDEKEDGKNDEGENEEEKKDSVASLIEQAMKPHIACLVTKQRK